jgi:hypothetical protein
MTTYEMVTKRREHGDLLTSWIALGQDKTKVNSPSYIARRKLYHVHQTVMEERTDITSLSTRVEVDD